MNLNQLPPQVTIMLGTQDGKGQGSQRTVADGLSFMFPHEDNNIFLTNSELGKKGIIFG